MNIRKDSLSIVRGFLIENGITINPDYYLREYIIRSEELLDLPEDIAKKIIGDAYGSSDFLVKEISEHL